MRTFVDIDCPNPRCGKPIVVELVSGKSIHCPHCNGGFNVDKSAAVRVFENDDMFPCPCCQKVLGVISGRTFYEVKPSLDRKKAKPA